MRTILYVMAINAVIISTFGIVQKVLGAEEIYWVQQSPTHLFFASFVYQNHWAAFAVLNFALLAGLFFRRFQNASFREIISRSTVLPFGLSLVIIAVSIVLSTSRSGMILLLTYVLILALWMTFINFKNKYSREIPGQRLIPLVIGSLLIVLMFSWFYSLTSSAVRNQFWELTEFAEELIGEKQAKKNLRVYAYKHTLEMIEARPVWGWGLGNYQKAFPMFQGAPHIWPNNRPKYFFRHTHNDWLETLAEIGVVGSILLSVPLLILVRPIFSKQRKISILPVCLILAIPVALLYAIIDFPFACPAVVSTCVVLFSFGIRYHHMDN